MKTEGIQLFLLSLSDRKERENQTLRKSFLKTLSNPYLEQKKIKNQLLKQIFGISEQALIEANQHHQWKSDFFSASYSGEWLFLGIAKEKIGVDFEIIKARTLTLLSKDETMLQKTFGRATWEGFYLYRTAREALLKASDAENLENIASMLVKNCIPLEQKIDHIPFSRVWTIVFQEKEWKIFSHAKNGSAYSICII